MKFAPIAFIASLIVLAFIGAKFRSFPLDETIECVYRMTALDEPAADILYLGSSRIGRGIDPVYVKDRLKNKHQLELNVERIALPGPFPQQYIPILKSYIENRGAPDVLFLQLLYNYKRDRHPKIDLPVNPGQNVAFAKLGDLIDIHQSVELNPGKARISRRFSQDYLNLPVTLLSRFELNVYAALKLPAHIWEGRRTACQGEAMFRHRHPVRLYGDISDDMKFEPETPEKRLNREKDQAVAATYMPMSPSASFRTFENQQIKILISTAKAAGIKVVLLYLPAVGETKFPKDAVQDLQSIFPGVEVLHPMSLYQGPQGKELAVSFDDTHHYDKYGALLASRYFADQIPRLMP